MPPEVAKLLFDMKRAAARIERFVAGKSYNDYVADELLRSGVERQFEIIGEAMTRLLKTDRTVAEKITDYRKIAGIPKCTDPRVRPHRRHDQLGCRDAEAARPETRVSRVARRMSVTAPRG